MVVEEITTLTIIDANGTKLVLGDLKGIRLSLSDDPTQATLYLSPSK
jgi:hypothetical protein